MTKPYRNQLQGEISCIYAYMFSPVIVIDINRKNALNINCYNYPYDKGHLNHLFVI